MFVGVELVFVYLGRVCRSSFRVVVEFSRFSRAYSVFKSWDIFYGREVFKLFVFFVFI